MARTKADSCSRKAVAAKAPRKIVPSPTSTSKVKVGKSGKNSCGGGNRYCPRPTPPWQKEISGFLIKPSKDDETSDISSDLAAECSGVSESSDDICEAGPSKSYPVTSEDSD